MYSLISHRGIYNVALKEYVVDTEADIASVPTDAPAGSKCFVIENSVTYMLNHKKQWKKVNLSTGSSSGGGGGSSSDQDEYDGGEPSLDDIPNAGDDDNYDGGEPSLGDDDNGYDGGEV